MIVIGGTYLEECDWPEWKRLIGPGVRAALAVSRLSPGGELFTYVDNDSQADLIETLSQGGVKASTRQRSKPIGFYYKHPLSPDPELESSEHRPAEPWVVDGSVVLAFPLLESRIVVNAERAVFEISRNKPDETQPEQEKPKDDIERGVVGSLALIASESDLPTRDGDFRDAASEIMVAHAAELMIVRKRAGGATLFDGEVIRDVPAYVAREWFKIGAGNVFCAMFAHYWGERKMGPLEAADLSSRAATIYAGAPAGALPIVGEDLSPDMELFDPCSPCKIFVASPCRSMAQQWLMDQAISSLWSLGVEPVSLYNLGLTGSRLEARDVEGILDDCHAVLALAEGADLASVLAVGLARVRGLPIVVLQEEARESRVDLWQGTQCEIARDFASAVYRAMVAGRRKARG